MLCAAFAITAYFASRNFGYSQPDEVDEQWRSDLAAAIIASPFETIEAYKEVSGNYPESIEELEEIARLFPEDERIYLYDPTNPIGDGKLGYFYYELIDTEHYFLLAVGPDRHPFTADDILPKIDKNSGRKVGLVVENGL